MCVCVCVCVCVCIKKIQKVNYDFKKVKNTLNLIT